MANESHLRPANTEEMRVTKSPLEIILLDDIAGQMFEMLEILRKQIPQGKIDPFEVIVNSTNFVIHEIGHPWMSFAVTNDGPGVVEFLINRPGQRPVEIAVDESLDFDFKFPVVHDVHVRLQAAGSATLRFFGVY